MNLQEIIKKAEELGSYFITVTLRDKDRSEGDLTHFAFRKEFSFEDVISSLDACVRSMKVTSPRVPDVVIPKKIEEEQKPLKIAIITHFSRCPDSYSPGKAAKNLIKMLKKYGHTPVFFTQEGSLLSQDDIGCEVRHVVPKFRREKNIVNEEAKKKFIEVFKTELTEDFNLAITFDFYIDDCITYREAIKESAIKIPWLHYARSGVGTPIRFQMDNARYVYLNFADTEVFADKIGVDHKDVRTIFNEKDGEFFFRWDPITTMLVNRFRLYEKDIIQTYPMCSTRTSAKGLMDVITVFGELKKLGKKVCLIIPNSNGRKRSEELQQIQRIALENHGLTTDEFIFTSLLADEKYTISSELPNKVVAELFQISNLFIFPTRAENGPNVLLEASMTKNLVVINEDLPLLRDFCDPDSVLSFPFTSNRSLHYTGRTERSRHILAEEIIEQLDANKSDKQFRRVWRKHNSETIYREMLAPVLYEKL